jgi:deoxyribonucleoside regulator
MFSGDERRRAYLAKIASLYYERGKGQQEIALEIGVSRSAVSRLLTEAREAGIVEIKIHYPWRTSAELEQALCHTFGLTKAVVLAREDQPYERMLEGLGILAAQYFEEILHDGMMIGISWGLALYQMIKVMPICHLKNTEIVQLVGATGHENAGIDGPDLAALLAARLGGRCRYLHAPAVVETEAARETLLQDHNIHETLNRAEMCEVALVGIGTTASALNSMLRTGYLTEAELEHIRQAGAVGDVCAQHYAITGRWLDIDINRRTIGVGVPALGKIKTVIGVAGGTLKSAAILGALHGGFVNALITDDLAAQEVLALHQQVRVDGPLASRMAPSGGPPGIDMSRP